MRSYLGLIPASAKVRKRQNRMTILCIIISVLLVTTIFSVADMFIRTESGQLLEKHGSWHIKLETVSKEAAEKIAGRSDVLVTGWLEAFNTDADQPFYVGEKKAALYGTDYNYMTQLVNAIDEGHFPENDDEAVLSSNAKLALNVQIGDCVTIKTPAGDVDLTISGFGTDDKDSYQGQTYLIAVYMTQKAFDALMEQNRVSCSPFFYVRFQNGAKASKAIMELQQQYELSDENISENTAVMGLAGQSSNESVKRIYGMAAMLFVLVLLAGVLMISGSMNSNVAQRTKFFGMMRCIGASRKQIIRYVRLEALNWCKTAVPVGIITGIAVSWGVCAMLHYGIGGEFITMPVFAFSPVGLLSGALVGMITVLLAAQSPAKRASKVSPMAAVSGNSESVHLQRHTLKLNLCKVEGILGIYHAVISRKNWFLMTASFSLSIILFLCFSVGLDFARELIPSLRSWQPDMILNGYANECVLRQSLNETIGSIAGVEQTFGCAYMENVPAASSREGINHVNLVSYSDVLLDEAKESMIYGDLSEIYGDSGQVMTVLNKDNPLKVGDTVQIGGKEVEITCAVSTGVFPSEYSVICSEKTFERITGEQNYSMIGIQLNEEADEDTVKQINNLVPNHVIFDDLRETNKRDQATYFASVFVVYSFLTIIAMITIFNIINSISMSVSARVRQYGAMRAVGMDSRQLKKMIAAESGTYAVSGLIVGCGIGIPLSRALHDRLITHYFGVTWHLPVILIGIIFFFVFISSVAAVYAPAKRICSMSITETINEL